MRADPASTLPRAPHAPQEAHVDVSGPPVIGVALIICAVEIAAALILIW